MANVDADRNLLFGFLALQMDFVSREALLAALGAWVSDKSRDLGQIFLQKGPCPATGTPCWRRWSREHLQAHGDDPAKSLAALSSVGSVRKDVERIADADLRASLATVSVARPSDEDPYATRDPSVASPSAGADPLATRAPSVGTPSSAGARFRILRPHARGGLGEVFVAHDEELHREVALKEIQDRHADHPDSRSRFLLEAEITGGLEHPGIVPVYGLGQYADGRPFYAMRFIRGDSLEDADRAVPPGRGAGPRPGRAGAGAAPAAGPVRRRLQRDRLRPQPGGAAPRPEAGQHHAGPVRRDAGRRLGPGQAAGSPGREPRLRRRGRWSASVVEPDRPRRCRARPSARRPYMSPEQAAGRLDRLGPASDVYSLGATLYSLLTGRPPVEDRDVGSVLQQVQRGDFPPPRQVNAAVPPALEAICLKAMALRPEDRYASARALADDVEHWLADEPVAAYREPRSSGSAAGRGGTSRWSRGSPRCWSRRSWPWPSAPC